MTPTLYVYIAKHHHITSVYEYDVFIFCLRINLKKIVGSGAAGDIMYFNNYCIDCSDCTSGV